MVNIVGIIFKRFRTNRRISNVFKSSHKRTVLISYITSPFTGQRAAHTNQLESLAIAQVFNEVGFNVDVVDYTTTKQIDYSRYDLVFGFGIPFERSFQNYNTRLRRIYYATGAHVCFQNHAEIRRIIEFNLKYRVRTIPKRIVPWTWSLSTTMTDAMLIIGNEWTRSTYSQFTKVPTTLIKATAFVNDKTIGLQRDLPITRKSFLWFGSSGLVHKGLDLCLEYFSLHGDEILHICGPREEDLFLVMKEVLRLPNIHFHGFVDVNSQQFLEIIRQCSFCILPTCSEGQSTSLLTAMGAGLIPISSRYCGLDIEGYGFVIEDLNVAGVSKAVDLASALTISEISLMSAKAQELVLQYHTIDRFSAQIRSALSSGIIN